MRLASVIAIAASVAAGCGHPKIAATDPGAEDTLERRAVKAAIWGMPIVSVNAMREGFFGVDARYGDIAYYSKPADWKLQVTTPNSSSLYVYVQLNTADGPMVLEVPPAAGAGLFGSISDAWQVPVVDVGPEGEDGGKGGKYLVLPPGDGWVPAGYIPVRSTTYNGYALLRAIPKSRSAADTRKAIALVKRLRLYALSQARRPPPQRHVDAAGKPFEGIARMDDTFFDSLAEMVNEEPVAPRDAAAMENLRTLGIEKGKPFKPDAATREVLANAAVEARRRFMAAGTRLVPYWPGARWGLASFVTVGAKTGFTFATETGLDVEGRGATFFLACAAPKKLGAATLYLTGAFDAAGATLDGGKAYHLHVPPNVPARQFWAVTVYDLETAAFFREAPTTEVNSYQPVQTNADGSVDVFFGPEPPAGKRSNWIYTAPGKQWITFFRFYGPEPAVHDKTWALPDIQR